jgi:hypothetical protein
MRRYWITILLASFAASAFASHPPRADTATCEPLKAAEKQTLARSGKGSGAGEGGGGGG